MTTYGVNHYGPPTLYGRQRPVRVIPGGSTLPTISNAYLVDPFTATPVNYTSVMLTWSGPDPTTSTPMNEFRLLSSRYGFPVDENDGNILFDTDALPGTQFVDQNVVPGEITYYGFYILGASSQWIRAGFTACLMPVNHGYLSRLWGYLPEYLRDIENGELTSNAAGDTYLSQFLQVVAWPLDYIKTQYDFLFNYQNDPMGMAFSDLAQLAAQVGMPFSGEIPAYFLRKAAANWAVVMQQRGSLAGIAEHISLLSGFGADVQLSRNILLEDDQSLPLDPVFPQWSAGIPYQEGEIVSWPVYPQWVLSQAYVVDNYVVYNGVNYQCTATGGQGIPPAGAADSGTYWAVANGPFLYQCAEAVTSLPGTAPPGAEPPGDFPEGNSTWTVYFDHDAAEAYTAIPGLAGGVSTWEVLWADDLTAGVTAGSLTEGIGTRNPSNYENDLTENTLRVYNKGGSAQTTWLRSLSRLATDVTAGSEVPDQQAVIEHGVPVPQPASPWDPDVRYGTGDLASWGGRNYLALRASTGATPPGSGSSPEWAPLGNDARIPLMISAQAIQNLSQESTVQYQLYPFTEWYDAWGNWITRVFARTASAGVAGTPPGYTYDSFATGAGTSLAGRATDTQDQDWTVPEGSWLLDGNGNAYPVSPSAASMALVTAAVSCTQAVTFTEPPQSGMDAGLVFWYQSATAYWHAGLTGLYYKSGSTWTLAATYATPCVAGDRIYVVTSQATPEITVYRNVPLSYNAVTGNGQVAQVSGTTAIPSAVRPGSGATVYSGIASEAV